MWPVMSYLSQNNILNVRWKLIKYKLFLGRLQRTADLARGHVGPRDPAFSRILETASWSFRYLYCHFADTIPNSAQVHRYGPGFADNKDSLQSNTSCRSSKRCVCGGALEWFSVGNFFRTYFGWNLIKFSVQTNKLYLSLQGNIHVRQNIWGKTQSNT